MAVDRFTQSFLEELRDGGAADFHVAGVDAARALYRNVLATNGPGPRMHRVLDDVVRTDDGLAVPVRALVPVPQPLSVVVYLHGGGWVAGSADDAETIARKLAERTSSVFVLVDYRLAPEHPHPAAADDAYAAVQWASDRLADLAGKDVPLMVAGDDVGAALAAMTSVRARDEAGPTIDMQVLVCPVLDADVEPAEGPSAPWSSPDALRWCWTQYVPEGREQLEPEPFPARTADLAGLPTTVVALAEHSPARAAAEAYARRLEEAGVDVDAQAYQGQVHGFFMVLALPIGEKAFQQVIKAIRAYCARPAGVHH